MSKLTIGDRVAYSAAWLRSTGQMAGDSGHARGVIKKLIPLGSTMLAEIEWESGEHPGKVNVANLAKVGPNSRFCQC